MKHVTRALVKSNFSDATLIYSRVPIIRRPLFSCFFISINVLSSFLDPYPTHHFFNNNQKTPLVITE